MPFNLSKFPGLDEEEAGRKCWLENVEDQGRLTLDFLPPPPPWSQFFANTKTSVAHSPCHTTETGINKHSTAILPW